MIGACNFRVKVKRVIELLPPERRIVVRARDRSTNEREVSRFDGVMVVVRTGERRALERLPHATLWRALARARDKDAADIVGRLATVASHVVCTRVCRRRVLQPASATSMRSSAAAFHAVR